LKNRRDSFRLNWEHLVEAHILDSLKKPGLETKGFELLSQLLFKQ